MQQPAISVRGSFCMPIVVPGPRRTGAAATLRTYSIYDDLYRVHCHVATSIGVCGNLRVETSAPPGTAQTECPDWLHECNIPLSSCVNLWSASAATESAAGQSVHLDLAIWVRFLGASAQWPLSRDSVVQSAIKLELRWSATSEGL